MERISAEIVGGPGSGRHSFEHHVNDFRRLHVSSSELPWLQWAEVELSRDAVVVSIQVQCGEKSVVHELEITSAGRVTFSPAAIEPAAETKA